MNHNTLMHDVFLSYTVVSYAISTLGLLLNMLLLYLSIKQQRTKDEKCMANILITNTISNIILVFFFLTTNPQVEIQGGILFIKFGGIVQFIYNPTIKFIILGLIFSSYICVFTILPTEYIQRYNIICKNRVLDKSELIKLYGITFLYSLVAGFIHACNYDYIVPEEIKMNTDISSTIWNGENYDIWNKLIVLNKKTTFHVISGIIILIMIIATYVLIPYNIYKMSRIFKKNKNALTIRSIRLQQQFNRILYLQMIISIFIMVIPIITLLILLFSQVKGIYGFGLLLILGFQSIPLFNSFTVIFITPKYRKTILCRKKINVLNQTTEKIKPFSGRKT